LNDEGAAPHRRRSQYRVAKLHSAHHTVVSEPIYDYAEVVRAGTIGGLDEADNEYLDQKTNSKLRRWWSDVSGKRIPGTQWTRGAVMFCAYYLAANLVAVFYSYAIGDYTLGRGFGSLAAANTMLLIIPATRNNILTWGMGLAFDHIVLYHRFLGRTAILVAFVHGCFYVTQFVRNATTYINFSDFVNWTGAGALICGLVIVATTFDRVRRRFFNVFFFAHYSFVGFFTFAYMHSAAARPFLLTGIAAYGLDKVLRLLWTLLPRRTLVFRNSGDNIAQVQFPKNVIAKMLGRYKVGQYMFVNFPELSLHEWHPFSVSSGPWENHIELHIRGLGDHTNRIVALAKQCAAEGRQPWIRSDGPYGVHHFNYRRYGVLILVGGGVGITPVIGMLKDLYGGYGENDHRGPADFAPPHCIKQVYVLWIMPHATETEAFSDTLASHSLAARSNVSLPALDLRIHCTRAKADEVSPPLIAGRPDIPGLVNDAANSHPGESTLIFACGPGRMVNELWDETVKRNSRHHRFDFHHETFEF